MPISLPAIRYLLAIGFRHMRDVGRYGWLYAANAALHLLGTAAQGPAATLLLGFASAILLLVATRQVLTGAVTVGGRDVLAALRLVGLWLLAVLPAVAVGGFLVVALVQAPGAARGWVPAVVLPATLVTIYLLARLSFLAPALAIGDATGLKASFAQTAALWPLLLAVSAIAGVAIFLIGLVLPTLGVPRAAQAALTGLIGAATLLVAQAPICWLYARVTGRDASAIAR